MLFKILHGSPSSISLDITPFHEGWCYVTHDGYFYVDLNTGTEEIPNNQRLKLNANNAQKLCGMTLEELKAEFQAQSDWEQNDPEAEGYIKNRPFYEEENIGDTIILVPEENYGDAIVMDGAIIFSQGTVKFVAGNQYTLTINGVSKILTAEEGVIQGISAVYFGENLQGDIVYGFVGLYVPKTEIETAILITDEETFCSTFSLPSFDSFKDDSGAYDESKPIIVKLEETPIEKIIHQMSGKFIEDGYYTEGEEEILYTGSGEAGFKLISCNFVPKENQSYTIRINDNRYEGIIPKFGNDDSFGPTFSFVEGNKQQVSNSNDPDDSVYGEWCFVILVNTSQALLYSHIESHAAYTIEILSEPTIHRIPEKYLPEDIVIAEDITETKILVDKAPIEYVATAFPCVNTTIDVDTLSTINKVEFPSGVYDVTIQKFEPHMGDEIVPLYILGNPAANSGALAGIFAGLGIVPEDNGLPFAFGFGDGMPILLSADGIDMMASSNPEEDSNPPTPTIEQLAALERYSWVTLSESTPTGKKVPTNLLYKPDWSENDSDSPKYIENRPFYEEEVEKEYVVSEVDWFKVLASGQGGIITENPLEVGKEYTITMNGISRKYVAQETFHEDDGLMKRIIYLGDDPNDQENIVHGSSYFDVPDFGMTGMSLTDPDIVLRDWGVDVSNITSMVVKVTGTRKEKVPHPMSGKYIEDGYWSERYVDDKVYVDGAEFSYKVNTPEGIEPDEFPTYDGDFGDSGHRIVTIGGNTYETDILTYTVVYEDRKLILKVLGNPSNTTYKFIFIAPGGYTESDFADNGLPFTLSKIGDGINYGPIELDIFDGQEMQGNDARVEDGYDEELLALNQACLDALSRANPITIIGADNIETIHRIPEKYLPENTVLTEEVTGDNVAGQIYLENATLAYGEGADSGTEHYPEFIIDNIIDSPGMKLVEFPCGKFEAPLYYGSHEIEDEGEIIGEFKCSLLGNFNKLKDLRTLGETLIQLFPDISVEDNGLPFLLGYEQNVSGEKRLILFYADNTYMISLGTEEEFQQKLEILSRYSTVTISDLVTTTERKVPKDLLYKPNWNQNNPEAGDYIENRPFYEDASQVIEEEEIVLPETLLTTWIERQGEPTPVDTLMVAGETYRVTCNGVSKEFVAKEFADTTGMTAVYIGDDFESYVTDSDNFTPEVGFISATTSATGTKMATVLPLNQTLFAQLFEITSEEQSTTATVKQTHVMRKPFIKQLEGKFIKDMYYEDPDRAEVIENVILPDLTFGELLEGDAIPVSGYVFEVGHTYQFTCNGVTVDLECYEEIVEGITFRCIGDKLDFTTEEPIEIKCGFAWINAGFDGQWALAPEITDEEKAFEIFGEVTDDTVFNIKERIVKPFIKQIDPKFIKDMYYEEENISYKSIVENVTIQQMKEGIPTQGYVLEEGKDYLITINGVSVTSKCITDGEGRGRDLGIALDQDGNIVDVPYGVAILNTPYRDSYVLSGLVYDPEKAIATFGEVSEDTTGSVKEIIPTTIHHIPPKYIKDMYYEEEGGEEKRVIVENIRFSDLNFRGEHRLSLEAGRKYSIIVEGHEVRSTADAIVNDGGIAIYIGDIPNTPGSYGFSICEINDGNQDYTLCHITDEFTFIDRYGGPEDPYDSIITVSKIVPALIIHQIPEKYIPDSAKGGLTKEVADTLYAPIGTTGSTAIQIIRWEDDD